MVYNEPTCILGENIMAYCDKCGAYIPDGQSKCLACGYDEAEERERTSRAYQQQEDQRTQAEQRRRQRQEEDRKWAENEQRRRQMEEEFKRRQKQAEEKARSFVNRGSAGGWQQTDQGSFRVSTEDAGFSSSKGHNKLLAALSYVSILFLIPLIFAQDDEFAKFHAKQGARLFVCNAIGTVLGSIFSIGWVITLLLIYLMVVGIKNALNEKWEPLPYIGKFKLF